MNEITDGRDIDRDPDGANQQMARALRNVNQLRDDAKQLEKTGQPSNPEYFRDMKQANTALDEATEKAIGIKLPRNWNGEVEVRGMVIVPDGKDKKAAPEQEPDYYKVQARNEDGRATVLVERATAEQAKSLADRLTTVRDMANDTLQADGPAARAPTPIGLPGDVDGTSKPGLQDKESGGPAASAQSKALKDVTTTIDIAAALNGDPIAAASIAADAVIKKTEPTVTQPDPVLRAQRDPEDNRLMIADKDVERIYDKVVKSLVADKDAAKEEAVKTVDVRKEPPGSRDSGESAPKKIDDKEKDEKEFVTPETLRKRYIEAENKFYFRDDENKLAFEDKGKRLATDHNDPQVAKSMVELAEAKKWNTIKVKGADEFKREVWLQASMRGMQVQGYKPNDVDLAKLAEQRKERGALNTIEDVSRERQPSRTASTKAERAGQGEGKSASAGAPQVSVKDWATKAAVDAPVEKAAARSEPREATDKIVIDEQKRGLSEKQQVAIDTLKEVMRARGDSEKAVDMASKVAAENFHNNRVYAGKVVEHGPAPYENDPKNDQNYYVKLDTPQGEKVVWGVDLKRAMGEGDVKKGDVVAIAYQGKKEVTIPVKEMDASGKPTGKTVETVVDRITWDVHRLDKLRDEAKDRLLKDASATDRKQPEIKVYDRAAPRSAEREAPVREQSKDRQPEHAGRG